MAYTQVSSVLGCPQSLSMAMAGIACGLPATVDHQRIDGHCGALCARHRKVGGDLGSKDYGSCVWGDTLRMHLPPLSP